MKTSIPSGSFRNTLVVISLFLATAAWAGPSISVQSWPSTVTNEGEEAMFIFTLSSPATKTITLNFITGGMAVNGIDYVLFGGTGKNGRFVIPKGATSATLTMHTFSNDIDPTSTQNAVLQILGGQRYQVGRPSSAQVIIQNIK